MRIAVLGLATGHAIHRPQLRASVTSTDASKPAFWTVENWHGCQAIEWRRTGQAAWIGEFSCSLTAVSLTTLIDSALCRLPTRFLGGKENPLDLEWVVRAGFLTVHVTSDILG
jgi:hypothetical protein